jgi:hypothetical protein
MAPALVLSAFLSLPVTQPRPVAVPAFRPHPTMKFLPARGLPGRGETAPRDADDREVICGMTVIHQSPAADPKILVPPRETGAAVKRIEPQICGAAQPAPAK